ncbi:hypothetical protein [Amycolatopsis sp. NPDC054798]
MTHKDYARVGKSSSGRCCRPLRPLRRSIDVTLDGCCDHLTGIAPDEELHRHSTEIIARADVLLFGRVICEYEFVVRPRIAGHGPTLFADLPERLDLKLVDRREFASGVVVQRVRAGGLERRGRRQVL